MLRKLTLTALTVVFLLAAVPAWACGGLVAPNGTISLIRTTTLAAYHDGLEHYVTSFSFAGGGGKFGSIVPLPGIPSKVERGGDWTLQRLVREVAPPAPEALLFAARDSVHLSAGVEVILQTTIDALDITILKGGGFAVGQWAEEHGFRLPPDAPAVLDFYANRSPIFMAASFDASKARRLGQNVGDGTPIHLTIPTTNPWVPLRILGLGRKSAEPIQADVFLLTDRRPAMLPHPGRSFTLERSEPANDPLLSDLHRDKTMGWVPLHGMWFSYLKIDAPAALIDHDLAIDASGAGQPSPVAAGLAVANVVHPAPGLAWIWLSGGVLSAMFLLVLVATRRFLPARP